MTPARRDPDRLPDRERPVGRVGRAPRAETDEGGDLGRGLVVASWAGTGVLAVTVAAGVGALDTVAPAVVAVSAAMFLAGSVAFFLAYARAVARSRHELIGIGGLYFMAGSAPRSVRRSMMGSLWVEVALVVVAVAVKPFSSLVFTSLAPVYAIGLAGMWTSRHGAFPRKAGPGV